MKKLLSTLLAISLLASLTACGASSTGSSSSASGDSSTPSGSSGSSAKADQIVWLSQGVGDTAWEGQTKPILAAYEEATGTKVVGEFYSFDDLFEVIEVKIASGSSDYDVISVDVPMVAAYATRNYILPMDKYFTDAEKAQFTESGLAAGSWDGVLYAPPENTSTQVLWYNQKLLDEAGVAMPESSTEDRLTWDEVVDLARQTLAVVDPNGTNGISGINWQQVSRVYQMNAIPNSLGGANIGDDGFTVDGILNGDAWVEGMTWYQNLVNEGLSFKGINADEMSNYFYSDKIVFMVGGTWTASSCEANGMTTYGWAAMPTFAGHEDEVGTPTGSWHFGINAATKNEATAADFIKYFTLGEGNDMWLDINGDMPSRIDKLDAIINDPDAKGFLKIGAYEAKNTAVARALTPGFSEYSTILNATWEDVRNGSDVKQSLDAAVKQINSAMEKYK